MGLFGFKDRNQRILEDAIRDAASSGNVKRKTVTCPRCGERYTVTFLGPNDSKTCKCGYKMYSDQY